MAAPVIFDGRAGSCDGRAGSWKHCRLMAGSCDCHTSVSLWSTVDMRRCVWRRGSIAIIQTWRSIIIWELSAGRVPVIISSRYGRYRHGDRVMECSRHVVMPLMAIYGKLCIHHKPNHSGRCGDKQGDFKRQRHVRNIANITAVD